MYDDYFKKVLIVEDDLSFRKPLRDHLSSHNYTVSEADDGAMAMEKLLVHHPDLIILDLLLPKVDGFEVLHRIRTYPDQAVANTPVIILSNLSSNKDIEKAEAHKIEGYFVKSQTSFDEVLEKINSILFKDGKGPQDEVMDFTKPE